VGSDEWRVGRPLGGWPTSLGEDTEDHSFAAEVVHCLTQYKEPRISKGTQSWVLRFGGHWAAQGDIGP